MRRGDAADKDIDAKVQAAGLITDLKQREKAMQAIWAEVRDKVYWIPLLHLKTIHGMSAKVEWEPRPDDLMSVAEITLKD